MQSDHSNDDAENTVLSPSDEALMVAFVKGSRGAFDELFSRYKQALFGFFRRRVSDPAHAEELTQETFLGVLRASTRYAPDARFRTYLYAIALNILRADRRKAAFRAMFWTTATSLEPSVRNTLDTELFLRQALAKLESTDREILLLREFEQLSYAEISGLLQLPVNTVRSRLFRARAALREVLTVRRPRLERAGISESEGQV